MGGTFDPIHYGHLVAASEVAHLFDLDEVVFVPSGQPWQKERHVSAAEDRYLMTVIATASNPRFSVSRVDVDRAGPTYTRDTLRDLSALNPDSELYFITGADALASILSWQGWEELFDLARFIGVSRPGYELRDEHITGVVIRRGADDAQKQAIVSSAKTLQIEAFEEDGRDLKPLGEAPAPAPAAAPPASGS